MRPLLSHIYVDKNKVAGVDVKDKQIKQKIYDQYIEAFKKGVYSYIKEDYDSTSQEIIPRKYFSGGAFGYINGYVKNPIIALGKQIVATSDQLMKVMQVVARKSQALKRKVKINLVGSTPQLRDTLSDYILPETLATLLLGQKQRAAGSPVSLENIPGQLDDTFDSIENLIEEESGFKTVFPRYGTRYVQKLKGAGRITISEYKEVISKILKYLSGVNKRNEKTLLSIAELGTLFDKALLLSLIEEHRDFEMWTAINDYLNATMDLSQPVPRGKLFSNSSYTDYFKENGVTKLFNDTHQEIFDFLREIIINRTDISSSDFSDMVDIGFSSLPEEQKMVYQYARLSEVASMVKAGFGRPSRIEREFDLEAEGLDGLPVLGVLMRAGPIQGHVLDEIRMRSDSFGLMTQFPDHQIDPRTQKDTIVTHSGYFYDADGILTLAEFKNPLRIDYSISHLRSKMVNDIRKTGVPTPFSNGLASISGNKAAYNAVFKNSGLPFPLQAIWTSKDTEALSQRTANLGVERKEDEIRKTFESFFKKVFNGMGRWGAFRIFIKPSGGSGGRGVKSFDIGRRWTNPITPGGMREFRFKDAADHVLELSGSQDTVVIQTEILKLDFRGLLQESIELGHLVGSVASNLEQIFGRPVNPDAKIDWVIRNMISRDADGKTVVLARRIIVNDHKVANTSQGGEMISIEKYAPQIVNVFESFDAMNIRVVDWGVNYAESSYEDTKPLDGAQTHSNEIAIVDDIITQDRKPVPIEVDYGFTSNMWRVDEDRAEWTQAVLDRVVDRAVAYRAKMAASPVSHGYDDQLVNDTIEHHQADLHSIEAQRAIYDAINDTYSEDKDEQLIEERIRSARERNEEVVVGVGGLGIAGIGPSILQGAAQNIDDLKAIRKRVNRFYRQRFDSLPESVANAVWQLYVLVQEEEISVAQINGALTNIASAQDNYGAKLFTTIRAGGKKGTGETRCSECA